MAARVMRTRPRFDNWEVKFQLQLFPSEINPSDIQQALESAAMLIGMGDYRPKFGRFALVDFAELKSAKAA